ncbi:hypothetical protein JSY14_10025 [Brachybacterium sp. EF45031]|uniref:hypothetical protein n=1 Tax=Brachybacterium sillae TaxID=2810536 RepID=UPI00217DED70|nr:hypothetical protein [Brachybacterium sillae]MCS6712341.1 hypothetical protein [Brachybacterium sillae]
MTGRYREFQDAALTLARTSAERSVAEFLRQEGPEFFDLRRAATVLDDQEQLVAAAPLPSADDDPPFLIVTDRRVLRVVRGLLRWRVREERPRADITEVRLTGATLLSPPTVRFRSHAHRDLVAEVALIEAQEARLRDRLHRTFGDVYRES